MGLRLRLCPAYWAAILLGCGAVYGQGPIPVPYIYSEAPRYDSTAMVQGGERFPAGVALQLSAAGRTRPLAEGFTASADASVSFDAKRVLFSGRRKPGDRWQIWEMPAAGGVPRRVVSSAEDCIAPFYLPGDRMVYSQRTGSGWQLVSVGLDGGAPPSNPTDTNCQPEAVFCE